MVQGLNACLGNGQDLSSLVDADFGMLLHQVSKGEVVTNIEDLHSIFREAKRRQVTPRTYGSLGNEYLDALVRYNDSGLRTDLVRFQWASLNPDQQIIMITYGNSSVRSAIAQTQVETLSPVEFQILLGDVESSISGNAYFYGLSDQVREALESSGVVSKHLHNFRALINAEPELIESIMSRPGKTIEPEDLSAAVGKLVEVARTTFGEKYMAGFSAATSKSGSAGRSVADK